MGKPVSRHEWPGGLGAGVSHHQKWELFLLWPEQCAGLKSLRRRPSQNMKASARTLGLFEEVNPSPFLPLISLSQSELSVGVSEVMSGRGRQWKFGGKHRAQSVGRKETHT